MKAVLQRVLSSSVTVNDQVVSAIGKGVLVLAAIGPDDSKKDAERMASKILKMRLWPDENGLQWKKSVQDIDGEVLCVSQFTLFASTKKGNKPDFHGAAKPEIAKELYEHFLSSIRAQYLQERVKDGIFQAMMQVALVNDGPVCAQKANSPIYCACPAKKISAPTTQENSRVPSPGPEPIS
ncbi:D-tyrosyl-tRNA(Tyr) deacylase [Exophiala aquamarina CBS 119918]|uniref:D-aminoacyl-tRNA deacylase n=1 Tax=Exophiala aquamarina CBS 119918 TaxID=1182545 RepID=A0A072PST1_9EURO|nr:D-tyrosyl-tRNA(Tyr) deacylase [Exophiala aquamarina CBS 119918]KEF62936.1 D-tyrosyl-tRNA(Tyr) deacylase [Exophiala aquamarina CBS 119918]